MKMISNLVAEIRAFFFPKDKKSLDVIIAESDLEERVRIEKLLKERLEECLKIKSERQAILKTMTNEQLILAVMSVWLNATKADMAQWHGALREEIDDRISSKKVD